MNPNDLEAILAKHLDWLNNKEGGECANLQDANLQDANLQDANLQDAKLQYANLQYAKLQYANLQGANLQGANLQDANLQDANLSGVTGLLFAPKWLADNFITDQLGVIVYKAIGNTYFNAPPHWTVQPGQFITEIVQPSPTIDCGCGVNFATPAWLVKAYSQSLITAIWKCRIHWLDLASVIVPYNTDGKARCGRLQLLETVELDDLRSIEAKGNGNDPKS